MRLSKSVFAQGMALVLSLVGGLLFFQHVWPRAPWGQAHLLTAGTPAFAWLPPFIVYISWSNCRKPRLLCSLGNALLLVIYFLALNRLRHAQEQRFWSHADACRRSTASACPAGSLIADPPQPPVHWEWAAAAYFIALFGLYVLLLFLKRAPERQSARY